MNLLSQTLFPLRHLVGFYQWDAQNELRGRNKVEAAYLPASIPLPWTASLPVAMSPLSSSFPNDTAHTSHSYYLG